MSLKCALGHTVKKHGSCFMQLCVQARDGPRYSTQNDELLFVSCWRKIGLNLTARGKRHWQSNRDNFIMRSFVICALTGDHVKDDEIGCVHSAHVTTTERYQMKDLNMLGRVILK